MLLPLELQHSIDMTATGNDIGFVLTDRDFTRSFVIFSL